MSENIRFKSNAEIENYIAERAGARRFVKPFIDAFVEIIKKAPGGAVPPISWVAKSLPRFIEDLMEDQIGSAKQELKTRNSMRNNMTEDEE
jgi:hypothetical protein